MFRGVNRLFLTLQSLPSTLRRPCHTDVSLMFGSSTLVTFIVGVVGCLEGCLGSFGGLFGGRKERHEGKRAKEQIESEIVRHSEREGER